MEERSFATSPEELLRHAGWVRRLVSELVQDPGRRADVEQETWLAALTRWPRELADPKGWLRMVTLNVLRQGARGEARRLRRERDSARDEALPSTAELVGQADLQRRLVRAVLELDEPCRTTLLLFFFRGLSCAEIGRGAALPSSTVRNRLQRGLAAVRSRFERELGSPEESRRVLLAWLAFAPPRPSAALPLLRRGLTLLAGGCLLVTAARWWLRPAPESATGAPPTAAAATDGVVPLAQENLRASEIRPARVPLPVPPASSPARRSGRVVDEDGAPIAGALVTVAVAARFETEPVSLGTAVLTEADGSFALPVELQERPGLVLFAEKDGYVPARAAAAGSTVISLRSAAVVEGTVVDAATEAALAGVRISFGEYDWVDGAMRASVTDERGRFRIARVPPGPMSLRLARPGDAYQARRLFVPGLGTHRFEIALPSGELLVGRVVDGQTGAGLAGARLVLDFAEVARCGADGSFAIRGLERTERHDLEASLAGRCVAVLSLEAGDPAWPAEVLLPLFPECVLAGTLADQDGRPLPHAEIELESCPEGEGLEAPPALPAGVRLGSIQGQARTTRTDEHGAFTLDQLEAWRSWELVAIHPRIPRRASGGRIAFPQPGMRLIREVTFPPASAVLQGTVRVNSEPVHARLSWRGTLAAGEAETDEAGAYRIEALEAGPLTVRAGIEERGLELCAELGLVSGAENRHDFELSAPQTELTGIVRYHDGETVANHVVQAFSPARGGTGSRGMSDASGAFRLWVSSVAGEALTVRARSGPVWVSLFPVPAGSRGVELVLPRIGMLQVRVLGPGAADLTELEVAWREGAGAFVELPRFALVPLGADLWSVQAPAGRIDLEFRAPRSGCEPVRIEGARIDVGAVGAPLSVSFGRKEG